MLNANVQRNRVLVLELVGRERLRAGRSRLHVDSTRHLLVEVEPHDFGRERQVLDRSPAGDHAELCSVEVRIAGEVSTESAGWCQSKSCKGGAVVRAGIADRSV